MRTGKVICSDLGGLGNKIFHKGDSVTERNFPVNNFQKLVDGGFIEEDAIEVAKPKIEVNLEPVITEPEPETEQPEEPSPLLESLTHKRKRNK